MVQSQNQILMRARELAIKGAAHKAMTMSPRRGSRHSLRTPNGENLGIEHAQSRRESVRARVFTGLLDDSSRSAAGIDSKSDSRGSVSPRGASPGRILVAEGSPAATVSPSASVATQQPVVQIGGLGSGFAERVQDQTMRASIEEMDIFNVGAPQLERNKPSDKKDSLEQMKTAQFGKSPGSSRLKVLHSHDLEDLI